MLYLTCTMVSSEDLAHYGISRAKDWISVDCGTRVFCTSLTERGWMGKGMGLMCGISVA